MADDLKRRWFHRPNDTYHVLQHQLAGNERVGFGSVYTEIAGPFQRRQNAWWHGLAYFDHDDFNLVVLRDGVLAALLWNAEVVDDGADVLAEVSRQTGLKFDD